MACIYEKLIEFLVPRDDVVPLLLQYLYELTRVSSFLAGNLFDFLEP
jgi:hypothetical protein